MGEQKKILSCLMCLGPLYCLGLALGENLIAVFWVLLPALLPRSVIGGDSGTRTLEASTVERV